VNKEQYIYLTILQMLKAYITFLRLGRKIVKNGEPVTAKFVCSTLITYAYRKHYIDPVPFLSDEYTSPGDLARSGLFSQLFENFFLVTILTPKLVHSSFF
jgi:hypothetical protein